MVACTWPIAGWAQRRADAQLLVHQVWALVLVLLDVMLLQQLLRKLLPKLLLVLPDALVDVLDVAA